MPGHDRLEQKHHKFLMFDTYLAKLSQAKIGTL